MTQNLWKANRDTVFV